MKSLARSAFPLRCLLIVAAAALLALTSPQPALCLPTLPSPMEPPRLVNDFADMLSAEERDALERQSRMYYEKTSTQIYIVTVNDLEGSSSLDFATALGNAWGIGQKGKDNGIVLLVKPKGPDSRGEVAIALGSGVEKIISKQQAQGIIDNSLIPLFRKQLFAEGIQQTVHTLGLLLGNAFSPQSTSSRPNGAPNTEPDTPSVPDATPPQTAPRVSTHEPSFMQSMVELFSDPIVLGGSIFVAFLVLLVCTGHADVAGKILMALFALIGVIFAIATVFGGSRSTPNRGGGGSGGSSGGFSGGGGGGFSGGGASGSW